jgi:3-hydroxyacyl-CoA dehydrogenase
MRLLEVVRGAQTAPRTCSPTAMALAKKIKKTAVVSGVCDGFIGNRMIEQYSPPGRLAARGGLRARSRSTRPIEKFGLRDGPVPHGRPRRQRHRLGDPQAAATREASGHALQQDRRPAVRARPLRPEDRRRLVRLPQAGDRDADPVAVVERDSSTKHRRPSRHHAAQDRRRARSSSALVYALVNEGAQHPRRGHRAARLATSTSST